MEDDSSPVGRKRGRPRKPEVERAVLQATLEELGDSGFTGMSMDGIAAKAGVSKPAIYRRWQNKPALAIAAIRLLVAGESPLTGDLHTDVTNQLQSAYRNLQISGGMALIGTILAEINRHPEFLEAYRTSLLRPRQTTILGLLEHGKAQGEVDEDADLHSATSALLGSILIRYLSDEAPADETPADEAPADETPADEAPADETPADETPADDWARPIVDLVLRGIAP